MGVVARAACDRQAGTSTWLASAECDQSLQRDLTSTTQQHCRRAVQGEPPGAGSGHITATIVSAYPVAAVKHLLPENEVVTKTRTLTPLVFVMLAVAPQCHLEPVGVEIMCCRWCGSERGRGSHHHYHRKSPGYSLSHDQSPRRCPRRRSRESCSTGILLRHHLVHGAARASRQSPHVGPSRRGGRRLGRCRGVADGRAPRAGLAAGDTAAVAPAAGVHTLPAPIPEGGLVPVVVPDVEVLLP